MARRTARRIACRSTPRSRREVIGASLRATGLALLPPVIGRAAEIAFRSDPFTLGVADDERFRRIRRRGRVHADAQRAHAVHVEVGGLEPARAYWYRFASGGVRSPAGRTHTASAAGAPIQRLRLAVACCQRYEHGFYGAYRAIVADDPDLVVHLGDYIYEQKGVTRARSHNLPEARTLQDYRARYALYKLDPDLQSAHAACPWIVTSDDHEVDNDYADAQSEDAEPPELFLARRAAAYRAYYEHMPLPRSSMPHGPYQRLYGAHGFGDLVALYTLDGRHYRSPRACGGGLVDPCAELFETRRTMLGEAQEAWLTETLAASPARWNFAQQTVMAHFDQSANADVRYWADAWSGYPAARSPLIGAVDDVRRAESGTHVLASFDVADGRPGAVRG